VPPTRLPFGRDPELWTFVAAFDLTGTGRVACGDGIGEPLARRYCP